MRSSSGRAAWLRPHLVQARLRDLREVMVLVVVAHIVGQQIEGAVVAAGPGTGHGPAVAEKGKLNKLRVPGAPAINTINGPACTPATPFTPAPPARSPGRPLAPRPPVCLLPLREHVVLCNQVSRHGVQPAAQQGAGQQVDQRLGAPEEEHRHVDANHRHPVHQVGQGCGEHKDVVGRGWVHAG